eukprot:5803732-Amphidinium_carterae.1
MYTQSPFLGHASPGANSPQERSIPKPLTSNRFVEGNIHSTHEQLQKGAVHSYGGKHIESVLVL